MDIRKLQRAIVDGLEDVKAQDIVVYNTEALSPLFERVIIASGTSNRQTKALAASVRETVRERGGEVLSVEGEDNGEWIIVDCGAAVVHVMQPVVRQYYHLEEIWGGKAVRLKLGGKATGLPKASAAADDDDEGDVSTAAVPRKRVAQPARKAPGRPAPVKPAEEAVAAAPRKAPARKRSAAAAPKIERVVVKAPAPRTSPAVKQAARKAAARKTAARKTSAG